MIERRYDMVCVGGGPGGFPAAIAAARAGARTLLVERNGFLGGMAATGLGLLGYLDAAGNPALGGIAQAFVDRLVERGGSLGHERCPIHNSLTAINPEMVKLVALEMCEEAGVEMLFHCVPIDVQKNGGRLERAVLFGKGQRVSAEARVFIDATGDGELAEMAGAPFRCGQSADGRMQPATLMFTVSNVDLERLSAYMKAHPQEILLPDGCAADSSAFFRNGRGHCFIGFPALLQKARAAGKYNLPRNQFIYITSAEKGRLAINATCLPDVDATDPESLSRGVEEGSLQVLELLEVMRQFLPGFENCRLSAVAPLMGVRESRHFCARRRLTGEDVRRARRDEQTIALGAYPIDIHDGNGGDIRLEALDKPYGIPLGALIPEKTDGLILSGRIIDADREAFGSCRVMGTCMAVGEAAGVCAALAAKEKIPVSAVEAARVREVLLQNGAIL